jgi:CcmD family protein
MMDFLSHNQIYIVMTIILIIWAGIVWYLVRMDNRIKKLEDHSKRG